MVEWVASDQKLAGSNLLSPAVKQVGRRVRKGRGGKRKRGEGKGRTERVLAGGEGGSSTGVG